MESIFSEDNKLTARYWKKESIGDKIEGTLINVRTGINKLSGKEQKLYDLKTSDGETWIVSGTTGIDMQMENVRIGQIVGFEFVATKPAKIKGMNDAKIVQVYANPNIVDKDFLDARALVQDNGDDFDEEAEEAEAVGEADGELNPEALLDHPFFTEEEKTKLMETITELADSKLGINGDVQDVKNAVMEATSLAFIEANLAKIVVSLKQLPARK